MALNKICCLFGFTFAWQRRRLTYSCCHPRLCGDPAAAPACHFRRFPTCGRAPPPGSAGSLPARGERAINIKGFSHHGRKISISSLLFIWKALRPSKETKEALTFKTYRTTAFPFSSCTTESRGEASPPAGKLPALPGEQAFSQASFLISPCAFCRVGYSA